MPTDLANAVEMIHGILAGLGRSLQFVHVPAPRHRDDAAYYAPLAGLGLPEGCELYLGVIHHDDREGDRRRIAAASQSVTEFGIATECGWGRGDPTRAPGLLDSPPYRAGGGVSGAALRRGSPTGPREPSAGALRVPEGGR